MANINNLKKRIKWKTILPWIAVIWCVLPIVLACFYVVPSADDFYRMGDYKYIDPTGNPFLFSFWYAGVLYKTTMGAFFTSFLIAMPITHLFGVIGLRIFVLIGVILFFQSIWIVVRALLKKACAITERRDPLITWLFFFAVFFLAINTDLSESVFWLNGVCAYMTPLMVSFFSISCYLEYDLTSKVRYLFIGIILAILGSGGVLMVTGFHCISIFFLLVYDVAGKKSIKRKILFGIAALSGAIINVIDPAYYVRSKEYTTSPSAIQAIKISANRDVSLIGTYLQAGILLVIMLIVFLVLYQRLKNSSATFKLPGLVTVLGLLGIVITDFPVALGYSNDVFPARCMFVLNTVILFYLMIVVAYWAGWCAKKQLFSFTPQWFLLAGIVCFMQIVGYMIPAQFKELTPNKMLIHIARGDYEKVSDSQMSLLKQIEESNDEDVVVYEETQPDTVWVNIMPIGLREDPSHWINTGVAGYYGKRTIQKCVIEPSENYDGCFDD